MLGAPAASPSSWNMARGLQDPGVQDPSVQNPAFLLFCLTRASKALCRPQISCGHCKLTGAGMRSCLLHPRGRLVVAVVTQTWSFPSELPGFPP